MARLYNSGQCCCGIERIYVIEPLYDAFVEKAVAWTNNLTLGNPLDPATTLGPMANVRFADEVRAQTSEAVRDGAKALIDPARFRAGQRLGHLSRCRRCWSNVNHQMRVMRDESFGPVVGIMAVQGRRGSASR